MNDDIAKKLRRLTREENEGAVTFSEIPEHIADLHAIQNALVVALQDLQPLLDGSSGTYLGIYAEAAERLCKIMGWEDENDGVAESYTKQQRDDCIQAVHQHWKGTS